jgi:hypothetical protein
MRIFVGPAPAGAIASKLAISPLTDADGLSLSGSWSSATRRLQGEVACPLDLLRIDLLEGRALLEPYDLALGGVCPRDREIPGDPDLLGHCELDVVDGYGGEPVENAAVKVEGNLITAVGRTEDFGENPNGNMRVVDLGGKTLMPGLIEGHFHISFWGVSELPDLDLKLPAERTTVYAVKNAELALRFQHDPHWRDHIPFHEYFNGDNGAGLGASHQTGWTALIVSLLYEYGGQRADA